jgi:hypothetical protein
MHTAHCSRRFNFLTAEVMSIAVFWVVMSCSLADAYQGFGGIYCLHLQGIYLHVHPTHKTSHLYRRHNPRWRNLRTEGHTEQTAYCSRIRLVFGNYRVLKSIQVPVIQAEGFRT